MSTITETKPGTTPAPLTPAEVQRRLDEAEVRVSTLTDEHHRAAFEAEVGASGAEERLAVAAHQLQQAKARVATLQGALVCAREEEEHARRRIQAKLRRDNVAKITENLALRDAAAERLGSALEKAAGAWRELLDYSGKAVLPVPGMEFPAGAMTGLGDLRRAVERELFRVGATAERHQTDFPGANSHDLMMRENPTALPSLAVTVKEASTMVLARLGGDAAEATS